MADLRERIEKLRRERQAVILAHNYQPPEVQDLADHVGDSFALSEIAARVQAQVIVFCGVRFMAEGAAILAPEKTVLLPQPLAGCPLADTVGPEDVLRLREEHPGAAVVAYVNTPATVKAVSDICCTSSNAVQVVRSLPQEEIIFLPDGNLGRFVAAAVPEKRFILWRGHCRTHHRVVASRLAEVRAAYPQAPVLVHPECRPEVWREADFVGSTGAIIRRAAELPAREIIIGTEMGILHRLQRENPEKRFYLLDPGLVCPNMKMTRLEDVLRSLEDLAGQVTVPEDVRRPAGRALRRMLEVA